MSTSHKVVWPETYVRNSGGRPQLVSALEMPSTFFIWGREVYLSSPSLEQLTIEIYNITYLARPESFHAIFEVWGLITKINSPKIF